MDKKRLSIILIIIVLVLPALKMLKIPGLGALSTLSIMTISSIFMLLALPLLREKFSWHSKSDDELFITGQIDQPIVYYNNLIILEIILYFGLSILCIGVLFVCQHWPGASIMRMIGGFSTLVPALGIIVLINEENCTYASKIKTVSFVAILFSIVGLTNYYWDFIFKTQHSEYHHLVEVYSYHDNDDTEKAKERQVELQKYYILHSEDYNHLDSLLTKANTMAKDDHNAKVIYLIMCYKNRYGEKVSNMIFDEQTPIGSEDIDRFAQDYPSLFQSDVKFYVVTDNPEMATEKLKKLSSENKEIIIVE